MSRHRFRCSTVRPLSDLQRAEKTCCGRGRTGEDVEPPNKFTELRARRRCERSPASPGRASRPSRRFGSQPLGHKHSSLAQGKTLGQRQPEIEDDHIANVVFVDITASRQPRRPMTTIANDAPARMTSRLRAPQHEAILQPPWSERVPCRSKEQQTPLHRYRYRAVTTSCRRCGLLKGKAVKRLRHR